LVQYLYKGKKSWGGLASAGWRHPSGGWGLVVLAMGFNKEGVKSEVECSGGVPSVRWDDVCGIVVRCCWLLICVLGFRMHTVLSEAATYCLAAP